MTTKSKSQAVSRGTFLDWWLTGKESKDEQQVERQAIKKAGFAAAIFITCSKHEWQWTQKEQEAMARTIVILAEELQAKSDECGKLNSANTKLCKYVGEGCECTSEQLNLCYPCTLVKECSSYLPL